MNLLRYYYITVLYYMVRVFSVNVAQIEFRAYLYEIIVNILHIILVDNLIYNVM